MLILLQPFGSVHQWNHLFWGFSALGGFHNFKALTFLTKCFLYTGHILLLLSMLLRCVCLFIKYMC